MWATCAFAFVPAQAIKPLTRVGAHWYKGNNFLELQEQYQKNYEVWDAVLGWISSSGVQHLPAGKYYVHVGQDSVMVRIQDATTRAESKIEAHAKYIDLQWTFSGTEVYEYYDYEDVEPIDKFDGKKDVQHFQPKTDAKSVKHMRKHHTVVESRPDEVYLFFPREPHKAMLMKDEPSPVRKVVAKIPYVR